MYSHFLSGSEKDMTSLLILALQSGKEIWEHNPIKLINKM